MPKKTFVFDTNVIMNDAHSIFKFEDHQIVIPLVVLTELDKYKKGDAPRNFQVRLFHSLLDRMSGGDTSQRLFNGGVDLVLDGKKTGGKIAIKDFDFHDDLVKKLGEKNDYQIINTAYCLKQSLGHEVILISEDLNLRLTARALGLDAQGSRFNAASDDVLSYQGLSELTNEDHLNTLFSNNKLTIKSQELTQDLTPRHNEYYFSGDVIFRYSGDNTFSRVNSQKSLSAFGIRPKNKEQEVFMDLLLDDDIKIITASGPAGTGKTLLGLAAGFHQVQKKKFDHVLVSRREIGADQEEQGFLPGDAEAKSAPFMMPFVDNLKTLSSSKRNNKGALEKIKGDKTNPFEIVSLMYLRGRTLSNSFIIIDECQNLTPSLVKTIITRAGEGTKILFCGDLEQVDDKYLRKNLNGLSYLMQNLKDHRIYGHISLNEVERSELARLGTTLP